MQSFVLNVLGTEVSFKAEADPERLERARNLLDERFNLLKEHGKQLSKEKLLTFLALALADDVLQAGEEIQKFTVRAEELLKKVEQETALTAQPVQSAHTAQYGRNAGSVPLSAESVDMAGSPGGETGVLDNQTDERNAGEQSRNAPDRMFSATASAFRQG